MPIVTRERPNAKPEVEKLIERMTRQLLEALPAGTFAEREQAALELTNEVVRRTLEKELREISDGFADVVVVQGREYRRHEPGTVKYFSLCGLLKVLRWTYRLIGVHNGPTIVPLELETGIFGNATPQLARNVAHGYGENDMRAHQQLLEKAHRIAPPRATLERMAKVLASDMATQTLQIEPKVRRAERVPEQARGVVIGVDRTSAPMAEPSDKPAKPREKPYVRKQPEPIVVNYRMAYAASVSLVDEQGQALVTRRYAIGASDSEQAMMTRVMADVRHALNQRDDLNVAVVQDGAPEMWKLVEPGLKDLKQNGVITHWYEAIDFCHLMERLGQALELVDEQARKWRLEGWQQSFEQDDHTIDSVLSFLRFRRASFADAEQLKRLDEHITYIKNNKGRMRYKTLRSLGLPIGSGVTESTCKTVVNQRAKGAGQRWSCPGLRGALHLRALNASDRFDAYWAAFARTKVANVNNCVQAA